MCLCCIVIVFDVDDNVFVEFGMGYVLFDVLVGIGLVWEVLCDLVVVCFWYFILGWFGIGELVMLGDFGWELFDWLFWYFIEEVWMYVVVCLVV